MPKQAQGDVKTAVEGFALYRHYYGDQRCAQQSQSRHRVTFFEPSHSVRSPVASLSYQAINTKDIQSRSAQVGDANLHVFAVNLHRK